VGADQGEKVWQKSASMENPVRFRLRRNCLLRRNEKGVGVRRGGEGGQGSVDVPFVDMMRTAPELQKGGKETIQVREGRIAEKELSELMYAQPPMTNF